MKKDILFPKPDGVHMAVVQETDELNRTHHCVYLINTRPDTLDTILVTSKGYGKIDGEEKATSTLRKKLLDMAPHSAQKFEVLTEELLALNNEFWLSFYIGNQVYDKKYIFMAESIVDKNLTHVPILEKQGILIQ